MPLLGKRNELSLKRFCNLDAKDNFQYLNLPFISSQTCWKNFCRGVSTSSRADHWKSKFVVTWLLHYWLGWLPHASVLMKVAARSMQEQCRAFCTFELWALSQVFVIVVLARVATAPRCFSLRWKLALETAL